MSAQELLNDIIKKFVTYLEMPSTERQQVKQRKKVQQQNWGNRWFGVLPLAIMMLVKRRKRT